MTGTCAACLHTNQSRSYLNHLVLYYIVLQHVTLYCIFVFVFYLCHVYFFFCVCLSCIPVLFCVMYDLCMFQYDTVAVHTYTVIMTCFIS